MPVGKEGRIREGCQWIVGWRWMRRSEEEGGICQRRIDQRWRLIQHPPSGITFCTHTHTHRPSFRHLAW